MDDSEEWFGSFVDHDAFSTKDMAYYRAECVRRARPENGMTVALEAETQGVLVKARNTSLGVVHDIYITTGTQPGEDRRIGYVVFGVFNAV